MKNYKELTREYDDVVDEISNLKWLEQYGSFPECIRETMIKRLTGRSLAELEKEKKRLETCIRRYKNLQMA